MPESSTYLVPIRLGLLIILTSQAGSVPEEQFPPSLASIPEEESLVEVTRISGIAEVLALAVIECLDELLSSLIAYGNDNGWRFFISRIPAMIFYTAIKLPPDFFLAKINRDVVTAEADSGFFVARILFVGLIVRSARPLRVKFYSRSVTNVRGLD